MKTIIPFSRTILPGLAGLLGISALLVSSLFSEYQDSKHHAQVEVENISRVLDEHALAIVQKTNLLLLDVLGDVHPDDMRQARGANSTRAKELHALLKSHVDTIPELSILHLTNATGEHIYSSIASLPHIDISDRYHFLRQKDDPNAGLVISPPIVSRTTGKWTFVLSRRINFEDGSFAGIINGILDLEYFKNFYRTINMGSHGVVSLYDKELRLVARYPHSEKDMGKISHIYARTYIDKGIKQATYNAKSPIDGVDRIYSFQQVGDLPLFVIAGIAEDDYLAEWRRDIWIYGVGFVIFCFLIIGFWLRQHRAEDALLKSESRLKELFENLSSGVAVYQVSPDGLDFIITAFNGAAERIENLHRENLIGKNVTEVFPGIKEFGLLEIFRRVWQSGIAEHFPISFYQDGRIAGWRNNYVYKLPNSEIVAIYDDVTKEKQAEEKMQHLAHHDALTGLPNRALFTDRLQQSFVTAKRDQSHFVLMFLDLDKFKSVNDELGHDVGDLLLKEAAERMQNCVRESDTVSRIGGDEFVVLLPAIDAEQDAMLVAEKILYALNQPFELAGHSISISASIGVAAYPEHGSDEKTLTKHADIAMYYAKSGGRNNALLYEVGMESNL